MNFALKPQQIEAMKGRFSDLVDVEREIRNAREYVEQVHTGRPYKNFGRFCWNWLRTAEDRRLARMNQRERLALEQRREAGRAPRATAVKPSLSREQLEAIARDPAEPEPIRELARRELEEMKA